MTHPSNISDIEAIHKLLTTYSFDAEAYQIEALITEWLTEFGAVWVSHAITEALYQGRYKLVSIDQILKLWQRRRQPIRHFNREFESIILGQTLLYPTSYGDGAESSAIRRVAPAMPQSVLEDQDPALDVSAPAPAESNLTSTDSEVADQLDTASFDAPEPAIEAENELAEGPWLHEAVKNPFATSAHPEETPAPAAEPPQAIPNFRPLTTDEPASWQQVDVIQPFVPRRDESELHQRLRAVVKGGMQE